MAEERARKPYLAMPSDNPIKVVAIPNRILQSKMHTIIPAAPNNTIEFLFQNASICKPTAPLYRKVVFLAASTGFFNTFFPKPNPELFNEKYLNPSNFLFHKKLPSGSNFLLGFCKTRGNGEDEKWVLCVFETH